jgi:hypothetical protein
MFIITNSDIKALAANYFFLDMRAVGHFCCDTDYSFSKMKETERGILYDGDEIAYRQKRAHSCLEHAHKDGLSGPYLTKSLRRKNETVHVYDDGSIIVVGEDDPEVGYAFHSLQDYKDNPEGPCVSRAIY